MRVGCRQDPRWPAAGAVEGYGNAREQRQLTLVEMVLGYQPPPGYSLGQEAEGKAASSDCQNPGHCPGESGNSPPEPCPWKAQCGAGVGLAPVGGSGDEQVFQGFQGALYGRQPQWSQTWGTGGL